MPKLVFEKVEPPDQYVKNYWSRGNKKPIVQEYRDSIEGMELGDSFEVTGIYALSTSIREAFKLRGWKCSIRCQGTEEYQNMHRLFKIRVWRVE